jgi:hypothetical protein
MLSQGGWHSAKKVCGSFVGFNAQTIAFAGALNGALKCHPRYVRIEAHGRRERANT